ncbi:MAG TPA: hypothetical protein VFR41_00645, partial [Acidimicrobiia bacterium]|nr:hypothetical protein [Acidimicrobiia bacterium]
TGGSKAAWITDALGHLRANYPQIRGLLWFEKPKPDADNMDWAVESSADARGAFANAIGSSAFAGDNYGSRTASPIPPP